MTSWCGSAASPTGVEAGINFGLGNMFDYSGPMLWIAQFFHDAGTTADALIEAFDATINQLHTQPVDPATLDRAQVKMRSALYAQPRDVRRVRPRQPARLVRAVRRRPGRINRLEAEFAKVTPELLQETAREYLRPGNRTIYTVTPGAKPAAPATDARSEPRGTMRILTRSRTHPCHGPAVDAPPSSAPASAQPARESPPPAGTPRNFTLPKPTRFTLPNGLR